MNLLSQNLRFYQVIEPDADAFLTGVGIHSRVVDMRKFGHCTFILMMGTNAATAFTVTVEAVDVVALTNDHEVPFWYSYGTTLVHGNTMAAVTKVAVPATGLPVLAANADTVHIIDVDAEDCRQVMVTAGHEFIGVRIALHETAGAAAVDGACLAVLSQPRYMDDANGMPAALLA